jgi:galactose-1-phosphate uridylyltransferase (family 1)
MECGRKHGQEVAIPASAVESAAAILGAGFTAPRATPLAGRSRPESHALGPHYDPKCYLCPGNQRVGGTVNPAYEGVFSFVNDFSALLPELPAVAEQPGSPLLVSEPVRGLCKVLCFHPDHSLTLARMTREEIRRVVDAWTGEFRELSASTGSSTCRFSRIAGR